MSPQKVDTSVSAPDERKFSGRIFSPKRGWFTTAAAIVSVVSLFAGLGGIGVAWIILTGSVAVASVCAPRRTEEDPTIFSTVVANTPIGFLLLAGWVTLAGLVFSYLHLPLWRTSTESTLLWVFTMAVTVLLGWVRRGEINVIGKDYPVSITYLFLWGVGLMIAFTQNFTIWSRNVASSTDFVRHLSFVKETITSGNLTYSSDVFFQTYPRNIHAITGVLWNAADGASYVEAWKALESVSWLVTTFIFATLVLVASTVAKRINLPAWLGSALAPFLIVFILMQGAWINNLEYGFINSVAAGVVFTVLFAYGICSRWKGSLTSVLLCFLSFFLISHSWTILSPVVAVLTVVTYILWLRSSQRILPIFTVTATGLLTLAVALPVFVISLDISSQVAGTNAAQSNAGTFAVFSLIGDSNLTTPTLWWATGTIVSLVFVFAAMRKKPELSSQMWWYVATIGLGLALSLALIALTHSTWRSISYYPLKTLWTVLPLTLPFAVLGCGWFLYSLTQRSLKMRRPYNLFGLGAVSLILMCTVIVFAGQTIGSPYLKRKIVSVTSGNPKIGNNILIPIADYLQKSNLTAKDETGKIFIFGYLPYGNVVNVSSGNVQIFDIMGEEVGSWVGYIPVSDTSKPYSAAFNQIDLGKVCSLIEDNPNALYLTGPNSESGPERLIENGCPENIVQPSRWRAVPIGPEWFATSTFENQPYEYPTKEELEVYSKSGGRLFGGQ